jgi:hypothetical protein
VTRRDRFTDMGPLVVILTLPGGRSPTPADGMPDKLNPAKGSRSHPTRVVTDDHVLIRYSEDQPRDDHGRFGEGGGGGSRPSDVAADKYGNTRENGQWFDDDGGHMTDAYVEKYDLYDMNDTEYHRVIGH